MPINKDLKKIIDRIKFEFSITQIQIANKIGVKNTYLSDMINGRVPFNESFKNKLYEEFHIDCDSLGFEKENNENAPITPLNQTDTLLAIIESQQRTIESQASSIKNLSETINLLSGEK